MFQNCKIIKYAIIAFFFYTISNAQIIQWQNTIGGNNDDWPNFIDLTSDGNYITGGYSYSDISRDKTENSRGFNDFWLVKIDNTSGNIIWQKTIGGISGDNLISAKETADGGYILGGYSSSPISGEKIQISRGYDDYWVVKLDANRNIVWSKTYGGSGSDRLTSILQTDDGGYLIGGSSDSYISGEKSENSKGDLDMWIIKIDALGNIIWQKTFGGSNKDWVESMVKTPDGGYILAGNSFSNISGNKTQNSNGFGDYWVIKIDATGTIVWQKNIGGNNGDYAKSIVATSDGNYIIGGESSSNISGEKNENTVGNSVDSWIIKMDNNGQLLWQKNIGSHSTDSFKDIRTTSENGLAIIMMSYSENIGIKTEPSRGGGDYWMIKLNTNGNFEWDKTIGGDNLDTPSSIIQGVDGSYVMAGWSRSNISGDKTETKSGLQDLWYVKIKFCYNQPLPTATSPQSFCIQQNVTLNDIAITGQNIKWYDALTAGNLLSNTTPLQNGITYYASQTINECESERISVKVNVQNTLIPTGNTSQSFCSSQNPTLNSISVVGSDIKWYDSATLGNLLTATTPLSNGRTYYASQTENNCESTRLGVTVSVVDTPPAPTGNTNQAFCKNENATLNNIQISGQNIKWYDSNLATTVLPNTTLLENNKIYYASQTIGCESPRTAFLIQINDTPLPTGSNNQQFCIDENATISNLNITGTNLKWYDSAVNGNNLPDSILQNGLYYATQTLNNCESGRYVVTVKIQDAQIPIADSPQIFCIQKNALIRDINISGQNIKWYDSSTSSINLPESTRLENGITYYASQTINNCESVRAPITINILEATTAECINLVDELPFPKFFTPNNDSYNDRWTIDFAYLAPNTKIKIFNRYGKLVTELNLNDSWDGTYNGYELPATDYWFVVTKVNGEVYKSHFSLKR